jgi:hypothetical protein
VRPQADLFLATQDGVLETVDGEVQKVLLEQMGDRQRFDLAIVGV